MTQDGDTDGVMTMPTSNGAASCEISMEIPVEGLRQNKKKNSNGKSRSHRLNSLNQNHESDIDPADELLMHNYNTLPRQCQKFWSRRYKLFSKFDEGIFMTSEMWFSVTPEAIAIMTTRIMSALIESHHSVLDVCCGAGGNTILFASEFNHVVGIDISENNIKCTNHNAGIYGVAERISTVLGDWNELSSISKITGEPRLDWIPSELLSKRSASTSYIFDAAFSSPPWGGPSYSRSEQSFDVNAMEPFSLYLYLKSLLQYTRNVCLFLPRTLNLEQIRQVTKEVMGSEAKCRVIYMYDLQWCVALLALFGPEFASPDADYSKIFEPIDPSNSVYLD